MTQESNNQKTLYKFGVLDGLVRGTAITSNLFSIACISLLPGFGTSGLLISNTIQMIASGTLEIPTGLAADRFGWRQALLLGFYLKLIVTLLFIIAVFCSFFKYHSLIWLFFAAEAVIDALASSLINGSYQSAFLKWYEVETNSRNLPPLFLASFKYATAIRFFVPVGITIIFFIVEKIGPTDESAHFYSVITAFTLILSLRIITISSIRKKLSSPIFSWRDKKKNQLQTPKLRSLFFNLSKDRNLYLYSNSLLLSSFFNFFVIGNLFKKLNELEFSTINTWIMGIVSALTVYLLRTLVSTYIYPKIANYNKLLLTACSSFILILFLCLLTFTSLFVTNVIFTITILFFIGTTGGLISDTTQKLVESNLSSTVKDEYRATWLSSASSLGYITFGALSGIFYLAGLNESILWGLCIIFAFTTFFSSSVYLNQTQMSFSISNFSNRLKLEFNRILIPLILGFSILDITFFAYNEIQQKRDSENSLTSLIAESLREPLIQGSFIEAGRRLKSFQKKGSYICAELIAWDFRTDPCPSESAELRFVGSTSTPITLGDGLRSTVGNIKIYFDQSSVYKTIIARIVIDLSLFFVLAIFFGFAFRRIGRGLGDELKNVLRLVEAEADSPKQITVDEFRQLAQSIIRLNRLNTLNARNLALSQQARQVAHDIQSPLSALEIVSEIVDNIEPEKRTILKNSINRIREIAKSLGDKGANKNLIDSDHKKFFPVGADTRDPTATLLWPLLQGVISEKKIQYRGHQNININYVQGVAIGEIFCFLNQNEFQTIISNLIDNAVEALLATNKNTCSQVNINISRVTSLFVEIEIVDQGIGIPNFILERLGEQGLTYGKPLGSGLGVHHAMKNLNAWGGGLLFKSTQGEGTCAKIKLKCEPAPEWFCTKIEIRDQFKIVIMDDDVTVHQLWNRRFNEINTSETTIKIESFKNPDELRRFFYENRSNLMNLVFLLDYEITGFEETGLDLIRALGIEKQSILVTGHSDDTNLRNECLSWKIKMIPKSISGFVTIEKY